VPRNGRATRLGVDDPAWRPFEVDGETFHWTAYSSTMRSTKKGSREPGPWEPMELLTVARAPNTRGAARVFPAGTIVTEADAAEFARMMKRDGRKF
jgi:hypothetical protein